MLPPLPVISTVLTLLAMLGASAADGERGPTVFSIRTGLGATTGIGITEAEFKSVVASPLVTSASYKTNPGVVWDLGGLAYLPMTQKVNFVAGLFLTVQANTNDYTIVVSGSTITGHEKYSSAGLKIVAGVDFPIQDYFHIEVLPYLGAASVTNASSDNSGTTYPDDTGSLSLYGLTAGGYFLSKSRFEIGARIGYVGAKGTMKSKSGGNDYDVQQSGGLISLDLGYRF